jgi:hypothetical protein
MSNGAGQLRLAVLIDGDNISHRLADRLFSEVGKFGKANVRQLFGNLSGPAAEAWKAAVHRYGIVSRQQFANTSKKNGTDISLVVEAMDLLHRGEVDGFCIASSDSDFTRLATRIREQGLAVFGFGKATAASSFRKACQDYVELDVPAPAAPKAAAPPSVAKVKAAAQELLINRARNLFLKAFGQLHGADWYPLSELLAAVRTLEPKFTVKDYGFTKPITLVRKTECFDTEVRGGTMMVRRRAKVSALNTKAA